MHSLSRNIKIPSMQKGFGGKVVCVSGAGKGIGKQIAISFAENGARVGFFDKDSTKVAQVEKELTALGADFVSEEVDVTNSPQVEEFVKKLKTKLGPIDILINNVGMGLVKKFENTTEEDFDQVFSTNLKGSFFLTQQVVKEMKGGSSIIFVSSIHAEHPSLDPTYDSSKAAVNSLVTNLALDLAARNIRVNAVSPGHIDVENSQPRAREDVPLGQKAGLPVDVANACLFLANNAVAGYITGVNLPLTGGLHIPIAKDIKF